MPTSSNTNSFKGVFTALVTPFYTDGSIDWKSYESLVDSQLNARVHGLVACGTTAETPALTHEERVALIEKTVKRAAGRAQVLAGTGANETKKTIADSVEACSLGVDGLLVVTPYYNKPSQLGLERHFLAVAEAVSKPIVLYNVPGRTGVSIAPEIVGRLAEHPRIVGIKEATGNMALLTEMRRAVRAHTQKPFVFLSGDDPTFWPFLANGGDGVISVSSNIQPRVMRTIFEDWSEGRVGQGVALHEKVYDFYKNLFIEPNPVPIKTVLSWQKKMQAQVRLPLAEMLPSHEATLKKSWEALLPHLREDRPREDVHV